MLSARHFKSILAVGVIATLLCGGCGLKGPLYSSDGSIEAGAQSNSSAVKRKKNPFSRIPAPQAQKQEQKQDRATPPPQPSDPSSGAPTDAPPAVDPDRPATTTPIPTP
jgi:predicted small lipoprotein YifL